MNCRHCGSPLAPGAFFCVECGRSVAEAEIGPPPGVRSVRAAAETRVVGAPHVDVPEPVEERPVEDVAVDEPLVEDAAVDERSVEDVPVDESVDDDPADVLPRTAFLAGAPLEDLEETRIVAPRRIGERFVLQFSTGESVIVMGSGLIGRNPSAEPGEYVDQLVAVFDVGKSVSKTHVEFGQEAGRFWIGDRYTTNGTVIRPSDGASIRCEPGKRYMISRGTRVEVGEQFFIVS